MRWIIKRKTQRKLTINALGCVLLFQTILYMIKILNGNSRKCAARSALSFRFQLLFRFCQTEPELQRNKWFSFYLLFRFLYVPLCGTKCSARQEEQNVPQRSGTKCSLKRNKTFRKTRGTKFSQTKKNKMFLKQR